MIGHRPRFRENGDLLPWLGSAAKKKPPPFLNEPALMTREIMHSRDAQCNTGNDLKVAPYYERRPSRTRVTKRNLVNFP